MANTLEPVHSPEPPIGVEDERLWNVARDLASGNVSACDSLMKELGSPPPILEWMPAREKLPHAEFMDLLGWWEETRGEKAAPEPAQVDPVDLARSLGNLILTEVVNDGEDFQVRLFGSKVADHAPDLTGERLSTIWTPMRFYFMVNYRAVCLRPQPLFSKHTPAMEINIRAWDRLILPLMEGNKVQRILIGIYPTERQ